MLAEFSVRLLGRLYPNLTLQGPDRLTSDLAKLATEINPNIELDSASPVVGIAIGDGASFPTTIFAGSAGWDALISTAAPLPVGASANPFGSAAAASFAVANVFRRAFLDDWQARLDDALHFSVYDRIPEPTATAVPNDGWALTGDAVLVGLGAIGNGVAWVLGRAPLDGTVHLVDHETTELSNLQRYLLTRRGDCDRPKVDIAADSFDTRASYVKHDQTWAEFLVEHGYEWPYVLAALDSAADRRAVQDALPGWVANAWTQPADLGVSVHERFGGNGACLACLYLPDREVPNEDELVAGALGVPDRQAQVRELLFTGSEVPRDLLDAVAGRLGRPIEDLLSFQHRPLRELYVDGICGGAVLPLGQAGTPRQDVHVPLSHQSALAGVLLGGSLVRASLGGGPTPTAVTRLDVMGPVAPYPTQAALKAPGCVCADKDFLAAYAIKYDQ
jgi:hypothetical protein